VIQRYWETVTYNDANHESEVFSQKEFLLRDFVSELSRLTRPGRLLDFGSNYGRFLVLAKTYGWEAYGFEPCQDAVEASRQKGFEVRTGWSLEQARFPDRFFDAVTAIDSFCFPEHPHVTLTSFHRVLKRGGVLAMRVSNKRSVLGLMRRLAPEGMARDRRLSKILQAQSHTIHVSQLKRILLSVGFDNVRIIPRAFTAPWSSLRALTKITYMGADVLRYLTFAKVNVSPGVAVFARKSE
jgi:SAM-dependent methyltransferase